MVQWLRLCTPSAGDPGLIPSEGTRSHLQQLKNPACCNEDWRSHAIGYIRRFSWLPEFGAWIAIVWLHLRFHFLIYKMWPYNSFLKGLMWRLSELIWVLRLEQCLILKEISTCMHAQLLSRVQLFATPWTEAYQAPLSMGSSQQEYWSGLPLP